MQRIRRRKFGEILLAEGVINQDQLEKALERQSATGEALGEILLQSGELTEGDIVRTICVQYQLPFLNPGQYEFNIELLNQFTPEFLYLHRLLPLDRIGGTVILALGEIPPVEVEKQLEEKLAAELYYYFSSVTEVENLLRGHFSLSQDQTLAIDERRRARNREGGEPAATVTVQNNLLDTLDSSWESIFDEAERNLSVEE